tara:strand:- start:62379 stop:63098 length:720 start_codon:yes stop_codon:yes gene_type:complete
MTKDSNIIVKELPKSGTLETCNLYIKNVTVFYAAVHEPKKKYQSEDKEFSLTAFVDEATKDKLLDEVMVNKSFLLVGKDKTQKPPRRIKYPLSSQVEEGKVNYDIVDGMYGFSVARPEFSKKGNPMAVNVIDVNGNPFTENVGNGSVCNIKMFAYRNQDDQAVVMLDTVQVIEHVPYEAKGNSGSVEDDVLGVTYKTKQVDIPSETLVEDDQKTNSKSAKPKQSKPESEFDNFDSDIPF